MQILDIKLARHGEVPVLVADGTGRRYNIAKIPTEKIICDEKDIDLTKANFVFPVMVGENRARREYSLHN